VCAAVVTSAHAQESDADRPVLLDFGQGNAVPPEAPSSKPTEAPQVEALPPPPEATPSQTAPPPTNATATPPAANGWVVTPPLDPSSRPAPDASFARLAVYFELLGPGLLYSLNVDLVVGDMIALRAGYSSFEFFGSVTLVPVFASYLGYGSPDQRYELGLGAIINQDGFDDGVLPAALVGYRYQPLEGGFLFRVGATLLFSLNENFVLPWPYVSLGATF